MHYFKLILLTTLFTFNYYCYAQSTIDNEVQLKSGDYDLVEALQALKETGFRLAFSSNKLSSKKVSIKKGETVKALFDRLSKNKIINYKVERSQIIVTPYQEFRFTVSGLIKDAETGEHLIGASIQITGTTTGTISNGYGFYSLTLPEKIYQLSISHIGYQPHLTEITLNTDSYLTIVLQPATQLLDEVEVNPISSDFNVVSTIPSVSRIKFGREIGQIPYFLGEVDVIQNALLQPGIKTIGEDASGIHVRGGGVDQNLILLDEATIYNPFHFLFIPIFNPEAVNDVRVLKGYIPPSYGGRASSVVEVRQKEGNINNLSYSGGIGPLSARVLVEGPFRKSKSSFLVSGRQSIVNLSIDDFASNSLRKSRTSFQDVNIKLNSRPNKYNTYYLSGYFGNDRSVTGLNSIGNWGNKMANFRWNHLFSPKVFSNLSAFVTEYVYRIQSEEEPGSFVSKSRIVDYSFKSDITYVFNPTNEVNFGISTVYHRLKPGDREPFDVDASTNTIRLDTENAIESAAYFSQQTDLGKVQLNYGFRFSMFHNLGPEDVRVYSSNVIADSTVVDTLSFGKNEIIKFYKNLEPRVALNWRLTETSSIKVAYGKSAQYLHLISNTLAPAPTDIWKLSDTYVPPTISHQYTLGYYRNFKNDLWEANLEGYYKDNLREVDYKNGADLIFNENIETELIIARGRAFGLEAYLAKKYGKLSGWLSYTLSRTETRIDQDDQRSYVLNIFDKTHDLSTTWVYKFSNRLSLSGNFIYATGIPLTLPSDKYIFDGNLIPLFGNRNESRLPDYHRLDLSLKLEGKKLKKDGSPRKNRDYWIFTLYNVYARKNVNSYFFRQAENNPGQGEIVQYSIFGTIIPGITYNFKF